ncbi:hypothetical protein E2C01_099070 [Portunus trituberculatus]|uniref:Uncharacterized protein n=1 Tax=Portunus trituberculatus TaxID=210409 RepID=A0A5B7JZC6_PORTR|nr:hypothetical protein [Portunus trituberculatus]
MDMIYNGTNETELSRRLDPRSTFPTSDLAPQRGRDSTGTITFNSVLIIVALFTREGIKCTKFVSVS